jgi:hypothetical protein
MSSTSLAPVEDEFGDTLYAEAKSPMKKEAAIKRKWVAAEAMDKLDQQLAEEPGFQIVL